MLSRACCVCLRPSAARRHARARRCLPWTGTYPTCSSLLPVRAAGIVSPIVSGLRQAAGDHSRSRPPSYASFVSAISQLDGPCGVPGRMQIGRGERGSPHSTTSVSTGLWLCALATKRKITTKTCTNFSPTSEKSEEEEKKKTNQTRQ
jgi:hypothetical protein